MIEPADKAPDLWVSPPRPPSRSAKVPSRFEAVAVFVVGWGWTLGQFALLLFLTWAFWTEYPDGWLQATLVLAWISYGYHLVTLRAHRRNDHRSDDGHSWCPTCYGEYRSHQRG